MFLDDAIVATEDDSRATSSLGGGDATAFEPCALHVDVELELFVEVGIRRRDFPGPQWRRTRLDERLWQPAYVSPEQLRGEVVNSRADVYSLGVVAFELLTGRTCPHRWTTSSGAACPSQ